MCRAGLAGGQNRSMVGDMKTTQEAILVTGASRGLGLAFVKALADSGALVWAGCRAPERAAALGELAAKHPGRVRVIQLDVDVDASIAAARAAVEAGVGRLTLLLNNAGVMEPEAGLERADRAAVNAVLATNVTGPLMMAKAFRGLLRAGAPARIVNISSILGSVGSREPGMGWNTYAYNASKAALNMVTVMLADELRAEGIDVTALHPGWVATEMGGPRAPLQPDESVALMLKVISGLKPGESGQFLGPEGEPLPW